MNSSILVPPLATTIGADSADHLLNISDDEIEAIAQSNTVAVLLPGTSFYLNLHEHARARTMIASGVVVALGSDFNSFVSYILFASNLGPSLSTYQADITMWNVGSLEEVPYNLGWNSVAQVIKKGQSVFKS